MDLVFRTGWVPSFLADKPDAHLYFILQVICGFNYIAYLVSSAHNFVVRLLMGNATFVRTVVAKV